MLNSEITKKVFSKQPSIEFKGRKLKPYNKGYWLIQPFFITIPYRHFYSHFQVNGWENVPIDKPVIFAISHRNAFMDSLALVNTKSTQVWQIARGDAFNKPMFARLFYFFHMLPVWREHDGVDTKAMNQPTFDACADLLSGNAMIGIYPEGNCINEMHIRPLKKGICRIAFLAEERYNFELDVHIIPVGIDYTDAERFKKWQFVNFGKPILLKSYNEAYKANPALAINQLKDEIEESMKAVSTHVEHSSMHHEIIAIAEFYARNEVLSSGNKYEPLTRFNGLKSITPKLEQLNLSNHDELKNLVHDFKLYTQIVAKNNFRENTFDSVRQSPLALVFMALYFLILFPVFVFGLIINYLPARIPKMYVESKLKRRIFWSSGKYLLGFIIFPIYYLILMFIVYAILGSLLSALIFLVAFPIAGNIAFFYYYDFKKWWSVIRFKNMDNAERIALLKQRQDLINRIKSI